MLRVMHQMKSIYERDRERYRERDALSEGERDIWRQIESYMYIYLFMSAGLAGLDLAGLGGAGLH